MAGVLAHRHHRTTTSRNLLPAWAVDAVEIGPGQRLSRSWDEAGNVQAPVGEGNKFTNALRTLGALPLLQ
jgi:hypothetical protein